MSQSPLGDSENPPILVLTSLRESHPFQERRIVLSDVIKVGRSVARFKPAPNNAIFDCKVLSRSHALIWYKDGKFWLRDTNSSNGTFVNNTRLHKKVGEEFSDREIFSGDIIRFGVDVVERDTTHGCIIAQVTLYFGNGCEAKPNLDQTGAVNGMVGINAFHSEQVFRLFHLASEALYREQSLVDKLEELKILVSHIRKISKTNWQAMLREEHLLQKLESYESQLSMLKNDLPSDSLQSQLCQVLEEKMNLEKASQITLSRVLDEKVEAVTKVADLEISLTDCERECARLREVCENTEEAYRTTAAELRTKVQEFDQLEQQLKTVMTEKEELQSQLKERTKEVDVLQDLMLNVKPNIKNKFIKVPSLNINDWNNCLENSEANFQQILGSTTYCIPEHLLNAMRHFMESLKVVQSIKDELCTLNKLVCNLAREAKNCGSTSSTVICDTAIFVSDAEFGYPTQLNDSSTHIEGNANTKEDFSGVLKRIRHLLVRLILTQGRAKYGLDRYCIQYFASRVCPTSDGATEDFKMTEEVKTESQVQCSTVPASTVDSALNDSRSAEVESSVEESEVVRLRQELTEMVAERDAFKEKALEYQEQDSSKSELLLSVREECDALRSRIAQIESEVVTSREDHQRLVSEARRSRAEAEDLRQERDYLTQEVATCQRQMEQLRIALAETLIQPKNSTLQPKTAVDSGGIETSPGTFSFSNSMQHTAVNNERNTSSTILGAESAANVTPAPMGMTRLFAIIPTMILLCAVMVFIFSKFAG